MKSPYPILTLACLCASIALTSCEKTTAAPEKVGSITPLSAGETVTFTPKYPAAKEIGTPVPIDDIPNLEKYDPKLAGGAGPSFQLPRDARNIAEGKRVTSSDPEPILGGLELLTDGDAETDDGCYTEFAPGHQWVQIDLELDHEISKLIVWHLHKAKAVYFDVNVQVSNDPEFKTGVTTLYNNDHDDSSKLGKGEDKAYVETNHGRLIDGKGTKARYVRLYSNGNTANEMNHYIEVQVYGTPAK